MPVTLTLEETKTLYEKHFGPMKGDMPYEQALKDLVGKFGGPRVEEMALEINPVVGEMKVIVTKIIKAKDKKHFLKRKRDERKMLFTFGWEVSEVFKS